MAASGGDVSQSGVPKAEFMGDVDAFMTAKGVETAEGYLTFLDELLQKYKYMESSFSQKKMRLKRQVPELSQSLEMIKLLRQKRESSADLVTQFVLSDQIYSKAEVPPTENVCLWLGANVMLEYPLDDAEALLTTNLSTAESNLSKLLNDMDFLRDQITTTEVNIARVYNWDVQRRRLAAQSGGASTSTNGL